MASLTRLSVLIAESDAARRREVAGLLSELGVQHISEVSDAAQLTAALRERAFDVLLCAERLGNDDGLALLRAARKSAPATRSVLARSSEHTGEPVPSDVDTLEVPFTRLSLEALLQQTASPHGGLWCEVPALSLSDILQMYHQARRSITVLLSGPIAGRVRLDAGEIVDAEMGDERGMVALSHLLEAETGLIRTAPAPAGAAEQTIDAPFQSVLLAAAQMLDERRRDQRGSEMTNEMTSVSADVLRPSVPLPFQAHAPDPASFHAPPFPPPRKRWGGTVAGVLLGGALAAGAAFYLQRESQRSRGSAGPDTPPNDTVQQSAHALQPASPAPGAATEPPAAPSIAEPPAVAPPASFTLHIASKPSRATVVEAGKTLGKTPLDISISQSSVAKAPRRFSVRHTGYVSSRVVQAASDSNVNAMVVLQPRSAPSIEQPDAGRSEPEGTGDRDTGSRGRRRELNLRTRR